MHVFQKHNISSAYRLAGGNDPFSAVKTPSKKTIRSEFASKISKTFLDALYAFLDGLVHLASDDWNLSLAGSNMITNPHPETALSNADMDLTSTVCLILVSHSLCN